MSERTIAAIATPLGEGGIGVIRISGENAISAAEKCFKAFSGTPLSALEGYRAAYGRVTDTNGDTVDDAVALVFRAPKSYTGEDTVEISIHGGRTVTRRVLRRVLECGAVLAEGGEFTKRAFLNGKLDLTAAESVMGLISARNDAALKISQGAREGRISRDTQKILDNLLEVAASVAAYSDYPDEDIPNLNSDSFLRLLNSAVLKCEKLISTYDAGRAVCEGISCAIVGKPNVGKSTLMNMLCGSERSIVTDIAGTTRDTVENTVAVGDVTLNLADTAGIHNASDTVEKFGIDRALKKIESSELLLSVFDSSSPLDDDDRQLLKNICGKKCIIILNKADLEQHINKEAFNGFEVVEISARSGKGYEQLCRAVNRICQTEMLSPDDAVLINERQRSCVCRAYDAVSAARDALESGMTLDAVGVCIDDAVAALLELTGKRVTNEVCDEIFKRFCVGK